MSETKKQSIEGLKAVNGIAYELPPKFSIVDKRTSKVSFADQNSYVSGSATEMVIKINSSADYVYGPNSYLAFDVASTATDAAGGDDFLGFGNLAVQTAAAPGRPQGSAYNLFSRLLVESRSGAELERVEQSNLEVSAARPFKYPADYKKTVQAAGQYPGYGTTSEYGLNADAVGSNLRVCIPMSWFSGLFATETLIPPQLISGATYRLTLETALRAMHQFAGGTPITGAVYTITDPRIVLDSLTLAPTIQRALMEQSQGGLPFVYKTLYHDQANVASGASSLNFQVNKSVSRAVCTEWLFASQAAATLPIQNISTIPPNVRQFQIRVGDSYRPQQPVRTGASVVQADVLKNSAEIYSSSIASLDKLGKHESPCSVSFDDWKRGTVGVSNGQAVIFQDLLMHPELPDSGLAINNSRSLEGMFELCTLGAPVALTAHMWLEYVKIAMVFPTNVSLKM